MNDLTIYDTLAESWWHVGSPLHLLARMNPARFAYFDPLVRHWSDLRVLDVGCGGGLATACLMQRGARVVGLDLSRASLHVAARQTRRPGHPEAVFICGRAETLPFTDASFDVVWCTDVLEHLADLPAAIAQIARVLKPGGLFLYDTINRSWLSRLLVIGFWEYLAGVAPRGTHDWRLFITPAELHRLLTQHGLQPGATQGMLPVWWSPRHGWRFRLIRYSGILYLGYAVKPAAPPQGGGGEPRAEGGQQRQTSAVQSDNGRTLWKWGGRCACAAYFAPVRLRALGSLCPPISRGESSLYNTHQCMRRLPPALLHGLLQVGGRQTEKTTGVAVGRPTAARGHALQPTAAAVTAFHEGDRRHARGLPRGGRLRATHWRGSRSNRSLWG